MKLTAKQQLIVDSLNNGGHLYAPLFKPSRTKPRLEINNKIIFLNPITIKSMVSKNIIHKPTLKTNRYYEYKLNDNYNANADKKEGGVQTSSKSLRGSITADAPIFLKIGNYLSREFNLIDGAGNRTNEQYLQINNIISNPDFLFATANPIGPHNPKESHKKFIFRYFTTDGYMKSVSITPGGKLKDNYVSDAPVLKKKEIELTKKLIEELKNNQHQ